MEKKIKAIVIEDDLQARKYLSTLVVNSFPNIEIIAESASVKESIILLNSTQPDLVFMDIELEDGLSFEIFEHLHSYTFEVIFITSFEDYVAKAFEHYAFNYIQKPLDPIILTKVITRYLSLKTRFSKSNFSRLKGFLDHTNTTLLINTGDTYINIQIANIIFCKSEGNYTRFYMEGKIEYLVSNLLKYYESLLFEKGFFRANRSTLLNTKHIVSIYKKETIVLSNEEHIHVSIRNKSKLNELIGFLS